MNTHLQEHIVWRFKREFDTDPILVKAPGRINLIGEHTDYNEGFVFPAAIDRCIIAAVQKSKSDICCAIADDANEQFNFSLHEIRPFAKGTWKNYIVGVVAELQKIGANITPFNLVFAGDIPIGAGLSSSAALENSLVFALNALFNLKLSRKEMIFVSQNAEHNYAKVRCGIMDMYASMFAKENSALFLDCRTLESTDYELDLGDYQLVLINTNVKHQLSESAYNHRRLLCEKAAVLMNKPALRDAHEEDLKKINAELSAADYQKILYVIQENRRVKEAVQSIVEKDLIGLGKLMYKTHYGLQKQYKVSCEELDYLVNQCKQTKEVIGARMMGGGFGGCTLNIVAKPALKSFSEKIAIDYKNRFNSACSIYSVELSGGTHLLS
ncbi:MAG: galactokinase [Bacteroidales bacterium]|nr:galactokinase [Bacteroidales bacterium]